MDKEYFVYILECNDGSFYKGMTFDIENRFHQHLLSQCNSTKKKNPKIVFVQVCPNRIEARKLEKYLKSGFGREIITEIIVK